MTEFEAADEEAHRLRARLNGLFPMPPRERADWVMRQILDGARIDTENREGIRDYLEMHFRYLDDPKRPDALRWARGVIRAILEADERGQGVQFAEAMNQARLFLMAKFDDDP